MEEPEVQEEWDENEEGGGGWWLGWVGRGCGNGGGGGGKAELRQIRTQGVRRLKEQEGGSSPPQQMHLSVASILARARQPQLHKSHSIHGIQSPPLHPHRPRTHSTVPTYQVDGNLRFCLLVS